MVVMLATRMNAHIVVRTSCRCQTLCESKKVEEKEYSTCANTVRKRKFLTVTKIKDTEYLPVLRVDRWEDSMVVAKVDQMVASWAYCHQYNSKNKASKYEVTRD